LYVVLDEDGGKLTDAGKAFLEGIGVDLTTTSKRKVSAVCVAVTNQATGAPAIC